MKPNHQHRRANSHLLALLFTTWMSWQALTDSIAVRYTGKLLVDGRPVADAVHVVDVQLSTDAEGRHIVWRDSFAIETDAGQFDILLGDGVPLPSFALFDERWVLLTTGGRTSPPMPVVRTTR